MSNTNLTLSKHWDSFIKQQIQIGRYASVNELINDSLRLLEQRETKLGLLRQALIEGEQSNPAGELNMDEIKRKARLQAGLTSDA